jgi:5'-3' exoribonuclease 1
MLQMTGLAVSRITSSLMVVLNDGTKTNLGLSLKFQGKGLKVLGYTRMEDRGWEYSARAVDLLREYKVTFPELFKKLDNRGDGRRLCALRSKYTDFMTTTSHDEGR